MNDEVGVVIRRGLMLLGGFGRHDRCTNDHVAEDPRTAWHLNIGCERQYVGRAVSVPETFVQFGHFSGIDDADAEIARGFDGVERRARPAPNLGFARDGYSTGSDLNRNLVIDRPHPASREWGAVRRRRHET